MPRMIDEDIIRNKPVNDAYRDGWERCFGEKSNGAESAVVTDVTGRRWRRCEDPKCPALEHPEDLHSHEVAPEDNVDE